MGSLFASMFRGSAVPTLLAYNGDNSLVVVTVDGEMVHPGLKCIVQSRSVITEVGVDGIERRVETCSIVFNKSDIGSLPGLHNPQVKYEFHIGTDIWNVDHRDGSAITQVSESTAAIAIRRARGTRKTLPEGAR